MTQNAVREKILEQFENWLDDLLAQETPLEGVSESLMAALVQQFESQDQQSALSREHQEYKPIETSTEEFLKPPDENNDLFSMWSAITVLTQEIKLQGRTFKRLNDQMTPMAGLNDTLLERLTEMTVRSQKEFDRVATDIHEIRRQEEKQTMVKAREEARREMVQQLIDTRTRLRIGLDSVKTSSDQLDKYRRSRWRYRLFKKKSAATRHMFEVVASLQKGYRMSLAQIDEMMQALGVQEISCRGRLFDPQIMSVVEVEKNNEVAEGTVLELYRDGYMIDGDILQPALVKVATASLEQ